MTGSAFVAETKLLIEGWDRLLGAGYDLVFCGSFVDQNPSMLSWSSMVFERCEQLAHLAPPPCSFCSIWKH
jgi:hypothetical protein